MPVNFSASVYFNKKIYPVVFIRRVRADGPCYEVNISAYPRFYMKLAAIGRYDKIEQDLNVPDELLLILSDTIQEKEAENG